MMKKSAKTAKISKPVLPPASRSTGEKMMRDVQKALASKSFVDLAEMNDFLKVLTSPGLKKSLADLEPESLKDEAQELAFDAMEAESKPQARKPAKLALAKDPDCVDALALLADIDAKSPQQAIAGLEKAVAAGERSLGTKFIKENKGDFWGLLETRPYMRALEQLAGLLRGEELYPDAIRHYETMLALNPDDNQGVRDPLLGLYLATGNLEGASKLLRDYKNDSMANFAWGRALECYLAADLPGAVTALEDARKTNRFVELDLSGQKPMPKHLPGMYSAGSDEEAILCLDNLSLAWVKHKEAVFWLLDQLQDNTVQKKMPARSGKKQNDK
jgi:tetratricopeptide (TPR) repeat protein